MGLLLTIPTIWGQNSLYALSSSNDIYRIDPLSCTSDLVISGSQFNITESFTDIAVEQNELYAISSSLLYKINLLSGQVDWINLGNGIDVLANGLTSGQNGFLYVSGHDLSRINVNNWGLEDIGTLGYSTQGDIEIINGEFYITARDSEGNPKLIKVTESPFSVTEIDSIPNNCYGASSHNSLPNNEIYLSKDSALLIIDINTGSTIISCPNIFDNYIVYGLTKGSNNLSIGKVNEEELTITYNSENNTILITSSFETQSKYCLRNSLGQVVDQSIFFGSTKTIDANNYPGGLYFITVEIGENVKTQKLIFK